MPENYFDGIENSVFERISAEPKVITLQPRRLNWIFAAAAVLILMIAIPLLNRLKIANGPADVAEIENYLQYHSEVSDDDIVELLTTEDIENVTVGYEINEEDLDDALPSNAEIEDLIY
ncbi:MAG TPA: hypothetical protein VGB50_10800 [Flavobacterium sp.]